MANSAAATDDIKSLVECSLCLSTFQQPKCLPCIHTFCQDCLQKYVDRNGTSDEHPCPLCRHMFLIPPQGLHSLPNNFFIQSMIELERKSGTESEEGMVEVKCDLCLDENNVDGTQAALKFCFECNQNMCQSCITCHGRMNSAKSHRLALLSEKLEDRVRAVSIHSGTCAKHSHQPVQLYCVKCDVCICVLCILTEHNGHICEDIKDATTKYLDKFEKNITKLNETIALGHSSVQDLKAAEDQVIKETSVNEEKIRERCNELRRILDSFEEELLSEARMFREKRIKEINSQQDQAEFQKVLLDGIVRYLREVKDKGSYYDIAGSGKELIKRTEELLTSSIETFTQQLKITQISFLPGHESIGVNFDKKLIGELLTGEKLLVAVGLHNGTSMEQKICWICLGKPDTVQVINATPAYICPQSAACVVSNILYAVGLGKAHNELWKWSAGRDEWIRCADMPSGRCRHGVTSVGDKVYVLGGWVDAGIRVLDSILRYDINSDKWTTAGQFLHAVEFPICMPYEHCVYVFGGHDKNKKHWEPVQVYDTTTGKLSSLGSNLPLWKHYKMRSVLWRSKAIFIGCENCFIYDFELKTCHERKRFRTGVMLFGLALDNNTLYISGGSTTRKNSAGVWTCRGDVKSLLVDDFISDNKEAEWKHHATLPTPALILAHSDKPLYVRRHS